MHKLLVEISMIQVVWHSRSETCQLVVDEEVALNIICLAGGVPVAALARDGRHFSYSRGMWTEDATGRMFEAPAKVYNRTRCGPSREHMRIIYGKTGKPAQPNCGVVYEPSYDRYFDGYSALMLDHEAEVAMM